MQHNSYAYIALLAALLHAALAGMMVSHAWTTKDRTMQMTYREQFSNWGELLRLANANASRADIMSAAWCNFTRPADTIQSDMCTCVDAQITQSLSESGVTPPAEGLVGSCLRKRGTWRVSHSWRIHPAISAYFALLFTACFIVASIKEPPVNDMWLYTSWAAAASSLSLFGAPDPVYNTLWVIASFSAATTITFVLMPGLKADFAKRRYESCLLWAEFFVAPVYTLDAVTFNSGRDIAYVLATICMGTLLASAGLRCMWYSVAFAEHPKVIAYLQWCAWMLIVAISAAFTLLLSAYHHPHPTLVMPNASVAMMAMTCTIAILQIPSLPRNAAIPAQSLLALARNITLAAVLWHDLT